MQGTEELTACAEETPSLIVSTRPATLQKIENPVRRVERAIQVRSVLSGWARDLMPRAYRRIISMWEVMSEQIWEANATSCQLTQSDKVAPNEHGDQMPTMNSTTKSPKKILGTF